MKTLLSFLLLMASAYAAAAVEVVSDSTTYSPAPTHCAWYLDGAAKEVLPVALDAAGRPYCRRDMTGTAEGAHTLRAAFVVRAASWGDKEGAQSDPFLFTVPASPSTVPANLKLIAK
jgi:hypothetical protein